MARSKPLWKNESELNPAQHVTWGSFVLVTTETAQYVLVGDGHYLRLWSADGALLAAVDRITVGRCLAARHPFQSHNGWGSGTPVARIQVYQGEFSLTVLVPKGMREAVEAMRLGGNMPQGLMRVREDG